MNIDIKRHKTIIQSNKLDEPAVAEDEWLLYKILKKGFGIPIKLNMSVAKQARQAKLLSIQTWNFINR